MMDFPIREEMRRFNRLNSEITALYHEASQLAGLSDAASFILYTVCEFSEGCSQSDICRYSGLSRQTVNSAVRVLAEDGILTSEEGSGRRRILRLTPYGEDFARRKIGPIMETEELIAKEFSPEDWRTLFALLGRFRDGFRARLPELEARLSGQ